MREAIVLPGYEKLIKYVYHLMKGNKIVRLNNISDQRKIIAYPYHRHEMIPILESSDIDIGNVVRVNWTVLKRSLRLDGDLLRL